MAITVRFVIKGSGIARHIGWSSRPTPWLTEHVPGIKVLAPGCKVIKIEPHPGNLQFAEGTFPTLYGIVKVKHVKLTNGKIKSTVHAPAGIKS